MLASRLKEFCYLANEDAMWHFQQLGFGFIPKAHSLVNIPFICGGHLFTRTI